jgi:hypothetical protein
MDLIQPRAVYSRVTSDEPGIQQDGNAYELKSIKSIQSFTSTRFVDDAPLLDYHPDYQITGQQPPSLNANAKAFLASLVPKRLHGWKLGALSAGILAGFSLIINIVAAIWLGEHKQGSNLVELYRGSCETVKQIDLWSHLAINALSTLLLGGSNYCMQCLCAPTRADIDRTHQRRRFLDIGVPSFRNLTAIPRHKAILWWILAISSIPLHLMYNSAFYKSLATNDYDIFFVRNDFVDSPLQLNSTWNLKNIGDLKSIHGNITNPAMFQRMELADCLDAYAVDFPSIRRNILFVVSDTNITSNFTVLDIQQYGYAVGTLDSPYSKTSYMYYNQKTPVYGVDNPYSWWVI